MPDRQATPKTFRYRLLHVAAHAATGPGRPPSWMPSTAPEPAYNHLPWRSLPSSTPAHEQSWLVVPSQHRLNVIEPSDIRQPVTRRVVVAQIIHQTACRLLVVMRRAVHA